MSSLTNASVSAYTRRDSDAHLARVHAALLYVFDLPDDTAATLPLPAARPPCGCGCGRPLASEADLSRGHLAGCPGPGGRGEDDEEDRGHRDGRDLRAHGDEDAFWNGYGLGRSGVSADAPHGYSAHDRSAFLEGLDAGWVELEHEDRLRWSDRFEAESLRLLMEDDDAQSRYETVEMNEVGMLWKGGA